MSHKKEEDIFSLVEESFPSEQHTIKKSPMDGTPSRFHGRLESSPKHFYGIILPSESSSILRGSVIQIVVKQVRKSEFVCISYKNWTCRHEIPCKLERNTIKLVHISSGNWTCWHIIQNLCTYPLGVEYVGTVEKIKVEIETKVTLRQEPYQNR